MIVRIKGDIIPNDYKEMYDYFGIESTAPSDISYAIAQMEKGDKLQVKINSGGGSVNAGQEIYSILRERSDVEIEIEGLAASAASVIAMAGPCTISPVGTIMIHNVSVGGMSGNKNDMEKMASTLGVYDECLANAYVYKTGKDKDEILDLMNKETWLSADKAVELGFVDGITPAGASAPTDSLVGLSITEEQIERFNAHKRAEEELKTEILSDLENFGKVI